MMKVYNEFLKRGLIGVGMLLAGVVSVWGGAPESSRTFMVGEDSYEFTSLYNDLIYLDEDDTVAGTVTSAFYHNGYIYIFQNFQLCAFPVPTSTEKVVAQPVYIENYSEGTNHPFRFYFFGATDAGEVFAASYVHAKPGQNSNPFEIFLLNFDNGWDTATVVKHWELPLESDSDWGPHNPQITGDLSTGNFTVAAQVWEHSAYNSQLSDTQYTTKIAVWQVTDNEVDRPQWGRAVLSPSQVTPLGDNKVLLHDKQHWSNISPKFTYSSVPQIVEITENHQLKTVSTLTAGCTQLDKYSCGAAIFKNGDNHLMAYHIGIGADQSEDEEEEGYVESVSNKMALAYLPDGVDNLSTAQELTTLMPIDNVSTSAIRSNESGVSQVSAIPLDDDRTLLLAIPYSHHNHLGVYTLSRQTQTTGLNLPDTTAVAPEYYTIDGIRINRPTTPGIYLLRQGTHVQKIIVK